MTRNRAFRRNAERWSRSHPGPRLCVLKTCLIIMDTLLHKALQVAGTAWVEKQERKAARGEARSYRMLEAAGNQDLIEYFASMMRVMLQLPLGIMLVSMTLQLKCLLYRVASRAMCSLHLLLRVPRGLHPYVLFRSLTTGIYDELPSCLRDSLADFFHKRFPDFTREARACLEALAEMTDKCISSIEARHALSRRLTVARGVQTWVPKVASTSAEFSLKQTLLLQKSQSTDSDKPDVTVGRRKGRAPGKQPGARGGGGGGAYRAFLHERSQGRRFTRIGIRQLTDEFHALDPEAMAYYEEQGRLATLAWRSGYHAFGARIKKDSAALALQQLPTEGLDLAACQELGSYGRGIYSVLDYPINIMCRHSNPGKPRSCWHLL